MGGIEHTPRLWSYSINCGPDGEANYANVFDGEERLVGNLRIYHALTVVRTMNAAPDMLEALKAIVAPYAGQTDQGLHSLLYEHEATLIENARAAIEKAGGKS